MICRRLPKPSFLGAWFPIHSVQKLVSIRGYKLPAFLIHPCKSVFIRGSLSASYSSGVLRHAIRLSPFGERMKVRGLFFGLAKSPFDA